MVVDLYPNVAENLKTPQSSEFEGEYFGKSVALKTTNWRGGRDRPIMIPFMNWWLNSKAISVIESAIRG